MTKRKTDACQPLPRKDAARKARLKKLGEQKPELRPSNVARLAQERATRSQLHEDQSALHLVRNADPSEAPYEAGATSAIRHLLCSKQMQPEYDFYLSCSGYPKGTKSRSRKNLWIC